MFEQTGIGRIGEIVVGMSAESILIGYADSPTTVPVEASFGSLTVTGQSGGPNDVADSDSRCSTSTD